MPLPAPLLTQADEIRAALDQRLYYVALMASLTLPDVCAGLETASGETCGKLYKQWYATYLGPEYTFITDVDIYSLRCGLVHQGKFGNDKHQYDRIVFLPPYQATVRISVNQGDTEELELDGRSTRVLHS
jgi:hypothetical protein